MPTNCSAPRLTRLAIVAVTGATALSLAACGSSNQSSPTSTSTSTSTSTVTSTATSQAPAPGEAKVRGLIASVAGNSIRVTKDDNSNATVNFTSTTKITEVSPATLSDVTNGSCITVRPTQEAQGGQPVTAASVRVSPSVNGTCPKPKENQPGSPAPPAPGSPAPTPPKPVRGSVASVAGNTITVAGTDDRGNTTQTPVTVDDATKYTKTVTATPDAIASGKCVSASGTLDNGGALRATTVKLRAAEDGKCPAKPPQGQGG